MAREQSGKTGRSVPAGEFDDLPQWLRDEGPVTLKPLKDKVRLRPDTCRLVDETHAFVARVDEAVYRSSAGAALVLVTRMLDVQAAAQLTGVLGVLRRVLMLEVPNPARPPRVNPRLMRGLILDQAAVAFVRSGRVIDSALFSDLGVAAGVAVGWREELRWLGGPLPADAYLIASPPGRRMVTLSEQCWEWLDASGGPPVIAKMALALAQLTLLSPMTNLDHLPQLSVLLQLIRNEVLRDQVLPMSSWLTRRGASFGAQLRAYTVGDVDACVVFFANGIRQACRNQMRLITRLEEIRERHLSPFTREDRFRDVVGGLIGHPITNKHHLADRYDISLDYAADLIDRLQAEKLVKVLELPSMIQQTGDKRWATVVFNREIITLLSKLLPLPEDGDFPV